MKKVIKKKNPLNKNIYIKKREMGLYISSLFNFVGGEAGGKERRILMVGLDAAG